MASDPDRADGLSPRWRLWALVAVLTVGAAWFVWTKLSGRQPEPPAPTAAVLPAAPVMPASLIGSSACASCHMGEHAAWTKSQHARAMQHATAETVLGDFRDAKYTKDGVTSTFTTRDGRFFVRTDGPDGKLADFEVRYTFGLEPLQQYLVELPGGRLQALAVNWDTRPKAAGGQRWFRQYPSEKIDFRDELHWTKRSQNWNFMCADCHSTQVRKGYDARSNTFDTKWSEVSVGCESCHGPGSAHAEWARTRSPDPGKGLTVTLDERRGVTWPLDAESGNAKRSTLRTSEREIEVCAQCHARRAQIAEGYQPGKPFLDHYLPSVLAPGLYHADGQQLDEVFIWGSWLQSKMHSKGVTCSDCHDPHTQKLRAEGNAVCAQCHLPSKYDAATHHHHAEGSPGAQCADCHMPKATYMVIDGRRDHSMRVPRPDQSVSLGVPNACNACHMTHDAKWAADALRGWLGRDPTGFQSFGEAFHAADTGRANAQPALTAIALDPSESPMARASALERLALAGSADAAAAARKAAGDVQSLLRLAAAQAASSLQERERAAVAGPLLADTRRAVRIEAARALAGQQDALPPEQRAAWQKAADEFVATQSYNADRPESQVALGTFHARLGRHDEAQAAMAVALKLDPAFVPAYVNGADALSAQGREGDAVALLKQGLVQVPNDASLHHALGLALVRQQQLPLALKEIERAAQLAPNEPRYAYVHAVALHSAGRPADAIRILERASERWPADRDMLLALATMQRDAGRRDAARAVVQRLLAANPGDRDAQALAAELR